MTEQPHTPTAAERDTFWRDVPIEQEWPVVDAAGGSRGRSGVERFTDTRTRPEAVRSPHSKPTVGKSRWGGWRVTFHCCAGWEMRWTQQDALAAALAHVAEHHTKPLLAASEAAERAQKPAEDAFWERYRRTLADDDEDDPFPPDPDHLSRVADDLTTLTANRRALDDAHRQGGPRA